MREVVLDASVVLKWFRHEQDATTRAARALEAEFRQGGIHVTVPRLLFLELINVTARRWSWPTEKLLAFARDLRALRFGVADPPLDRIAHWAGRGLSAYDACYVALAEDRRTVLITADEQILAVAGDVAEALGTA